MLSSRMPELTALQMLRLVHQTGSLSAAGKALGLSQQAVSSRMRALEKLAGSSLLERSPRGSTLTPTGALLADWAEDVLAAAERLDAGIASMRSGARRRLQVVASQTIAEHLLPQWLVLLRRHEESRGMTPALVELTVANSQSAAARVRAGDASLGFIESPNLPADLVCTTVQYDEMVVVVAPGHRWVRRRTPLTAEELASTPLVTRESGSGTRDALETILADRAPRTPIAQPLVELSTSAAVRSAIAAGTAPGVLSALAVRDDLQLHRLVAIPTLNLPLRRPLTAIWRTSTPPAGPAHDLIAIAGHASGAG
ncbi:MAG: LysR family transcriptional regulator [Microbacteriaceae bacterium]